MTLNSVISKLKHFPNKYLFKLRVLKYVYHILTELLGLLEKLQNFSDKLAPDICHYLPKAT